MILLFSQSCFLIWTRFRISTRLYSSSEPDEALVPDEVSDEASEPDEVSAPD